ncbi:MAG TPA: hypothetical protein VH595_02830 [Verrucomicrobiae bacterium]|jgi:hypothetical protein|nr:hypothetical protein [Verrucomicrobiae bacterium]
MEANRQLLIRALARWAQGKNPTDLTVPLKGIIATIMEGGFSEGKMLTKVDEAGGMAEFTPFPGCGPQQIIALCEETIEWIQQQPNPQKPRLDPRRLMRLKSSFGGYQRSLDHWYDRLVARSERR